MQAGATTNHAAWVLTGGLAALVVSIAYAAGRKFSPNHGHHDPVTLQQARRMGRALGVDWTTVSVDQLRRGMEVEQEHAETVGGDPRVIARIAMDHLVGEGGLRDYYTRLDAMEQRARRGLRPNKSKCRLTMMFHSSLTDEEPVIHTEVGPCDQLTRRAEWLRKWYGCEAHQIKVRVKRI